MKLILRSISYDMFLFSYCSFDGTKDINGGERYEPPIYAIMSKPHEPHKKNLNIIFFNTISAVTLNSHVWFLTRLAFVE